MAKISILVALAACLVPHAAGQNEAETCYGTGSVVGAVVGTTIIILGLLLSAYFVYKMYWKNRKGKHLVLISDAENPNDQYAFDNPCFREATPIKHNLQDEKHTSKLEKNKWLGWTSIPSFGKDQKNEKNTSMDDTCINDSRLKIVTLKSHDFTGLGFNICGNMRDGIFVKDVLHRGPAFESGCINPGDRIDSVCINFRNMVFEDALAILSYASPYDVQVQIENDSYSRPSTLIRSKRESSAVSSTERILHPKYNRSQSISHLNEIGKYQNKKMTHQIGFMQEKNRINQSLNKTHDYHSNQNDYPTLKVTSTTHTPMKENQKLEKTAASKISPMPTSKQNSNSPTTKDRDSPRSKSPQGDSQNKLQKFGIKVLPISSNPKMGVQSVTASKKPKEQSKPSTENETNLKKEKPEKPAKPKFQDVPLRSASPKPSESTSTGLDEPDASKENVKGILAKGLQNLKEKINVNSLGKKKKEGQENPSDEEGSFEKNEKANVTVTVASPSPESGKLSDGDHPVPKLRSAVACGVKAYEKSQQNHLPTGNSIPEEVSRAGDVARNNRKSITDPSLVSPRKSVTSLVSDSEDLTAEDKSKKPETGSESDSDSTKASEESKKPKRSKGKAPAPPQSVEAGKDLKPPSKQGLTSQQMNEIKSESEITKEEKLGIFEPDMRSTPLKGEDVEAGEEEGDNINKSRNLSSYDSDSDVELKTCSKDSPTNTKIELNATQVTIHQSPTGDGNDEDIEPSRKAASLGDLSKLDSELPLSIVLERAVSLDLTEGSSQCGKKRKAPLPPSEEFPAVFDDLNYRKEPRLENSLGLNTFQRRLKKSSDFGTLEDALNDGPKSLEIEVNKPSSLDLTDAHNYNIQEFSSWLAECRRPKGDTEESSEMKKPTSTSLVNVNTTDFSDSVKEPENDYRNNVSFCVNGQSIQNFDKTPSEAQTVNFPGVNSRTVVVISQPNSLEPSPAVSYVNETKETINGKWSGDFKLQPKVEENTQATPQSAVSSPLSSTLTYVTEIKVSTGDKDATRNQSNDSSSLSNDYENNSIEAPITKTIDPVQSFREKIEKFDSNAAILTKGAVKLRSNDENPVDKTESTVFESSKIPVRVMKSETGQRVLATIQSLAAADSPPTKVPEVEYAKRVASLFSGNNRLSSESLENDSGSPNASGFYFKTPPKPSKNYSPTRKVPPVVPPRKIETALSSKSTVTVELSGSQDSTTDPNDGREKNIVTFSSFIPNNKPEDQATSRISFTIRERREINGERGHDVDNVIPANTSATKIVYERDEKDSF